MNKQEIKALLEKFDTGNCTEQELAQLESSYLNWRNETPLSLTQQEIDHSLTKVWDKLQATERSTIKLYNTKAMIRAIAAILIVALGISFYYYTYYSKQNNAQIALATTIEPGSNKAWITLANGKKINLSSDKTGVNVRQGQLTYNDGDRVVSTDPTLLSQPLIVQTPRGGTYQVQLPDGTLVWLNAETKLTYYPIGKDGKRRVELDGEAYFEVAKDRAHPFIVQGKQQEVEVLGTHFNISNYADDQFAKTTLLEGSIKIGNDKLIPGQQAVVVNQKLSILPADLEQVMAWKNGDFVFKGEDFKTTMQKIARWYDVEVEYNENVQTDQIELIGWISRKSKLSEVLKRIQQVGNINFKIEGRRIIIEK